jgi:transcriptional regulator with XRE-family HTH domain
MNRLQTFRKAAGLSQKELAKKVGTNPQHLCRVECGLRPTYHLATRIAATIGCDVADLWPGAELPGMIHVPTKGGAA